jgi:hypothetical protein
MKITLLRILTTVGTVLFVAFSAWTTVSAAQITGRFLSRLLIPGLATTGTAVDTGTPTPVDTPMVTETPVVTGTPQVGETDDQDDSMDETGTTGTSQVGENDDEDENGGPTMSGTPDPGHSGDENNSNGGGNNNNGGGGGDEGDGDD